jgi:uncharacterized protein (DUF2236 family)
MTTARLDPDPGLFGPGSITWRVHGDPIMWIAGLRALFLQASHPAAIAGVLRHSDWATAAAVRTLRATTALAPRTYREGPHLRAARARLALTPTG